MMIWIFKILFRLFEGLMVLTPVLLIGSGIYAGFSIKKRWFYPALGYLVCCILIFDGIFMHTSLSFVEMVFYPILTEWIRIGWIVLLVISYVLMFVIAIMRRKGKRWINILISMILIAVTVFAFRIAFIELREDFREKYCTTYYKYPDYIIREMGWNSIQKWFGPFDLSGDRLSYRSWGAYYTYMDEQGNGWYYTIYFEEGDVMDIRMEIH